MTLTCDTSVTTLACVTTDPRRQAGAAGEQFAAAHLQRRGFEIIERNYRTRWGELDIVASNGRTLVFCEVRSRVGAGAERALESVGPRKRAQVRSLARRWLSDRTPRAHAPELRFDVIGVTLDRCGRLVALEHLEAAF
jgi:putative endonuclease